LRFFFRPIFSSSVDRNSSNDVCGAYIWSSYTRWSWCGFISSKNQTICRRFSYYLSRFINIWLLVHSVVFLFVFRLVFQTSRQIMYLKFLLRAYFFLFFTYKYFCVFDLYTWKQ
jgi:hypothetical protein